MHNVFEILGAYRKSIRAIQYDFMHSRKQSRNQIRQIHIVIGKVMTFMSNNTVQIAEFDALYNGIQALMAGSISHSILPHDSLTDALEHVQQHLARTQPHMTLSRTDYPYYYTQATFKTFRKNNTLFLVIDAPVTTTSLTSPFQLYELIKLPLPTPEVHDYYCMLATDITTVAFSRDADQIIQITGNNVPPHDSVWYATDSAISLVDRARPTCARAIIGAQLQEIKATCRYVVYKPPYPRSVIKLFGNTFLLTNITSLHLHCPTQNFAGNRTSHVIKLTEIQSIHKFHCHCDRIYADEFRIVADLEFCNDSAEISAVLTIHYPINLAYLSEYFTTDELFNLTADILLNHSVEIQLPDLAVADKFLDERFANEDAAAFDLEMVINSTKSSSKVYDDLAHFLFNEIVKANDMQNSFDLFSPFTWLSIFSWIASAIAIILVIILRVKVRSLTMMMAIRTAHAVPVDLAAKIPKILALTSPTPVTQSPIDILKEWSKHVGHITELVPIEVMILLCLLLWFIFKLARIIYASRKIKTVRTRLLLEIGNGTAMILLPIVGLPHSSRHYRLIINRSEIAFTLTETRLTAKLAWSRGVTLYNMALDMPTILPTTLPVPFWKIKFLKSLLQGQHYAVIQIVAESDVEIVALRGPRDEPQTLRLYPLPQ